jgi:hypothetical protein
MSSVFFSKVVFAGRKIFFSCLTSIIATKDMQHTGMGGESLYHTYLSDDLAWLGLIWLGLAWFEITGSGRSEISYLHTEIVIAPFIRFIY